MGIPHIVLYLVLNPFVYPLCWALLTGQAMFPAKHIVDRAIEDFIDNRKYPLTIKIILTPFYLLNYASGMCSRQNISSKNYFHILNSNRYYYRLFMALKVEYNYDFNSVSNYLLLIFKILPLVRCG